MVKRCNITHNSAVILGIDGQKVYIYHWLAMVGLPNSLCNKKSKINKVIMDGMK